MRIPASSALTPLLLVVLIPIQLRILISNRTKAGTRPKDIPETWVETGTYLLTA
jgi:hypothetical protein